jgi:hypothetical protein
MKTKIFVLLCILLLGVMLGSQIARGQPSGFVLERADASVNISVAPASELNTLITQVGPRFIVEYANTLKFYQVLAPPSELIDLIGSVGSRFVLEYANANRFYTVAYPNELIDDTAPPVILGIQFSSGGVIRWETDEYATSEMRIGTSPGVYTETYQSVLYSKVHQYQVPGMSPGVTYYFKVWNTDRSGNVSTSAESSVTLEQSLYIPLVNKR